PAIKAHRTSSQALKHGETANQEHSKNGRGKQKCGHHNRQRNDPPACSQPRKNLRANAGVSCLKSRIVNQSAQFIFVSITGNEHTFAPAFRYSWNKGGIMSSSWDAEIVLPMEQKRATCCS